MPKQEIVIIDDERDILDLLHYYLNREGFSVKCYESPLQALQGIHQAPPQLILCDWIMEEMDGLELCREIKLSPELNHIPFVMITCRDDEIDIVSALELGAEDYLIKPFRLRELCTRVKKIIKRNDTGNRMMKEANGVEPKSINGRNNLVRRGELLIDLDTYQAFLKEDALDLTYTEFRLLLLLAKRPGKVFNRFQIIEMMNGQDYFATERSVDVQIVGLRKKLKHYRKKIETVRSVGYRFSQTY